jgi:DnaJ-class molecular chaperone
MKTAALVTGTFLLFARGCGAQVPDHPDIVADLACETARMSVKLSQEMAPAPASDKCDNCDGTGKIGDGRIVMTCPVCKGTGKAVAK